LSRTDLKSSWGRREYFVVQKLWRWPYLATLTYNAQVQVSRVSGNGKAADKAFDTRPFVALAETKSIQTITGGRHLRARFVLAPITNLTSFPHGLAELLDPEWITSGLTTFPEYISVAVICSRVQGRLGALYVPENEDRGG